jgi:23S rRNA (cytidine1920-2'-O)/16S rRNA (cytidine1409-2'-O)-methyltransferase
VRVNGERVDKAGTPVDDDAQFQLAERPRFVSRGGEKLEGALGRFGVDVEGAVAADVGASTGGFTHCLLSRGAASVTAIDVGYGQLAWELRNDPRVTVVERTNIRSADPVALGAPFDVVVCDVSFISLCTVMPHLVALMGEQAHLLALVKPQFEAGKGRVGKRGVVRDPAIHLEVLERVGECARRFGLVVRGVAFSPIKGPEGNIEFWMWAARHGEETAEAAAEVVGAAHEALGG